MLRSGSAGSPGSAISSAGTPGSPSGPLVRSIQFTLTSDTQPANEIVSSTKYAPRSLSASRPMTQPATPGSTMAARSPIHGEQPPFTESSAVA